VTRSQRRARRRSRRRALSAVGAAAAVATGSIGLFGAAAGGGTSDPRPPRPAPVITEPALVAASENVHDRLEAQLAHAVMEQAAAQKAVDSIWDRIAACETQGNWSMQGPIFSGGLGFANSAWSAFGGHEFAPNAGQATREQQIIVAERIRASAGLGAWGCAKRV